MRGYKREDFTDAWERYIPASKPENDEKEGEADTSRPSPDKSVTSVTPSQGRNDAQKSPESQEAVLLPPLPTEREGNKVTDVTESPDHGRDFEQIQEPLSLDEEYAELLAEQDKEQTR